MFRLKLRDNDHCNRCSSKGADFKHVAWDCHPIQIFWAEVLGALDLMTGLHITMDPLTALLGYTQPLTAKMRKYISLALLLAKRRIACRWGRGRASKFKDWLQDLVYCQEQLQTYAELQPPSSRPKDIWGPLQTYLLEHATDTHAEAP